MNVTYSESVKRWQDGFALAQKGTERLEEALGPAVGETTAEWDRTEDDKGRAMFTVRLRDATDEVTAKLAPDELRSQAQMSARMYLLWVRLLQIRNQKMLDDIIKRR